MKPIKIRKLEKDIKSCLVKFPEIKAVSGKYCDYTIDVKGKRKLSGCCPVSLAYLNCCKHIPINYFGFTANYYVEKTYNLTQEEVIAFIDSFDYPNFGKIKRLKDKGRMKTVRLLALKLRKELIGDIS